MLEFHNRLEDINVDVDVHVNTADELSTSGKHLVNFGPVTPEFCRRLCFASGGLPAGLCHVFHVLYETIIMSSTAANRARTSPHGAFCLQEQLQTQRRRQTGCKQLRSQRTYKQRDRRRVVMASVYLQGTNDGTRHCSDSFYWRIAALVISSTIYTQSGCLEETVVLEIAASDITFAK